MNKNCDILHSWADGVRAGFKSLLCAGNLPIAVPQSSPSASFQVVTRTLDSDADQTDALEPRSCHLPLNMWKVQQGANLG